jgi:hypothetical protein
MASEPDDAEELVSAEEWKALAAMVGVWEVVGAAAPEAGSQSGAVVAKV